MQSSASKRAIIIGAGIGGIPAAIALQRAGLDVTVFERADELREVGSGLPLWASALKALQKIELNDVLRYPQDLCSPRDGHNGSYSNHAGENDPANRHYKRESITGYRVAFDCSLERHQYWLCAIHRSAGLGFCDWRACQRG